MRTRLLAAVAVAALLLAQSASAAGSLIKGSGPAVYYLSSNGKRYVFPNAQTYFTWYADFKSVVTVSDAQLASIGIGGNVTYKPGVRLVKIVSDPKVYAVDADGTLRWVKSEAAAVALYGTTWNQKVDDVPDAFFTDYKTGADISSASDFSPSSAATAATSIDVDKGVASAGGSSVDLTKLPLGDQKWSSTMPARGIIYTCQSSFPSTGGAQTNGPWIGSTTWDATKKVQVAGSVSWPEAAYSMTVSGDTRTITSKGLPVGGHTGTFPIASSDPAYQYDRNPNAISAQSLTYALAASPTANAQPNCVRGEVGIATNGVPMFDGFDAEGRDAAAHELQDSCGGHPQMNGEYHYHAGSSCVSDPGTGQSGLIGYALDGFGIYGSRGADGKVLTNADLDECHGTTSAVVWDGKLTVMYHYVVTHEFPYTVGCFKGTPITPPQAGGGGQMGPPGGNMYPPPPPWGY